jgi:drug/metabolite transporter (DMT)-like permease
MESWLFFALLSMASFTVYDLLGRKMSLANISPVAFAVIFNLATALISFSSFLFYPLVIVEKELSVQVIIMTIIAMFIWGFSGRLEFISRKLVEVSVFTIFIKIAPIITLIISSIFLGEKITMFKILAICLTLIANMLVSLDKNFKIKVDKGLYLSIMTAILMGTAWAFDKAISPYYSIPFYTIMNYFSVAMVILLLPPIKKSDIKKEIKNTNLGQIAILATSASFGYVFMIQAMRFGDITSVVLIVTSAAILVIVLSIFLLKERDKIPQKLIAGLLVIIAAVLLAS